MLIIHKRKKSLQDLCETDKNISKNYNNTNYDIQNNKKHFSLNKITSSPSEKNNKYALKKIRIKSPQKNNHQTTKYNSITFNHFYISSNNQKNTNENKSKKKNEVIFPKIKDSLRNQNNLSEVNINNSKTIEKPFSIYNNLKSFQSKKKNPISININVENNNKYLIDEELSNQRYKNHQTKSTKISKLKNLQKDKSQEDLKKRLFINSSESNQRNHSSVYYSNSSKTMNFDNKKDEEKIYNNHKLYESNNTKKRNIKNSTNNKLNKSINDNNIVLQNKRSYSKYKIQEKDKENKKDKIEIKRPKTNNENYNLNKSMNKIEKSINKLQVILDINPVDIGQKKEPIFLSSSIFTSIHSKFKPSIYSSDNEFSKNDFIKAYAYNTNEGNIRDYNEDTITATRVILDQKDKNNYFYFFAVYDGHGGNGCSLYLKNNLYKNIKEPTSKGLKSAINETEKNFLEKVAVNNGTLVDISGSCAIMVLLKNRKCIIANIGDSRCVLFKNKRVIFSTRDHKPNSAFEKQRIELAGGSVYQTQSVIPLFQNGKQIEIPWRVLPGGLSVSRTFGDIESKDIKFGGKKDVVAALPDVIEFELNEDYNFMVIGCDGIFDVLTNNEILECIQIVMRINKNKKINELCGDFASMIIKSALAKESFDNVSCIVVLFNINGIV